MRYVRFMTRAAVLGALLVAGPAQAQDAGLAVRFAEGVQALQAGQVEAAIDHFETIIEEAPTYMPVGQGSAAYWLGRAYEADGDPESVREVWTEGLNAFNDALQFDPRLSDAFVRLTFDQEHSTAYPLAARAYLRLLESLDWYPYGGDETALVEAHLARLLPIVPTTLQQQTGLDHLREEGLKGQAAEAGALLVAWWRSQDAAPASRANERIEEHLRRVSHAEATYAPQGDLDARGDVYIRLGEPSHTTAVTFDNLNFRSKVLDRSLTLHLSDFPRNEFWVYEHIDEAAQFLFYEVAGIYHLGEIRDLLPSVLRNGLGSTERGRSKARALVRTLDEIYRQLSLYHPGFAAIYQDVASYAGLLDEAEFVAQDAAQFQAGRQSADGQDSGSEVLPQEVRDALSSGANSTASVSLPGSVFSADRPDLFAQSILSQAHVEDEQALLQRRQYVPQTYTNTFDDADPLPTVVRLARFLDEDGTTRTEVYWGAPPGALQPSKAMRNTLRKAGHTSTDYLLLSTVVQQDDAYHERVVNYHRTLLRDLDADDAALPPQTYVARGDTGLYHLALQWDQYIVTLRADDEPIVLGMRAKAGTFRADSLQALSPDEQVLEMSDLKPMTVPEAAQEAAADRADAGMLYPFETLEKHTPLRLYFELYHLAFGPDDQTRYTVAYEVRPVKKGGLLRFLGGRQDEGMAAQTQYTGSSRTAQEQIVLDFEAWEGYGALQITVRVTDEVTGQHVERALPLTLVKRR